MPAVVVVAVAALVMAHAKHGRPFGALEASQIWASLPTHHLYRVCVWLKFIWPWAYRDGYHEFHRDYEHPRS